MSLKHPEKISFLRTCGIYVNTSGESGRPRRFHRIQTCRCLSLSLPRCMTGTVWTVNSLSKPPQVESLGVLEVFFLRKYSKVQMQKTGERRTVRQSVRSHIKRALRVQRGTELLRRGKQKG